MDAATDQTSTSREEALREQMMEWGAQRDAAREALATAEKRLARLEAENGRLRASLRVVYSSSRSALGPSADDD